ncbi:putative Y138_MYCPN ame: Full=UPF0134 protein MPN_138 [Rosellinia necatrix]|uniref:UPF0134 protein MPN_138 n=1 Tax=Rosellinia necatrix TaxID=77044 RepID=A0A1S7UK52_ROSNE|nr:putative Y138_MYCPN ame: Full=UPF0134 protein MPN_138 [Rosellinia necatrix]
MGAPAPALGPMPTALPQPNLPAANYGVEILQILRRLEHKVDGLDQKVDRLEQAVDRLEQAIGGLEQKVGGLERKVGGLEQKVGGLEQKAGSLGTRLAALDLNNISRLMNRDITDRNAPLQPLHAVLTNNPIANFPQTSAALTGLTETQVDSILEQLGQSVNGALADKKKRLRTVIGATKILEI